MHVALKRSGRGGPRRVLRWQSLVGDLGAWGDAQLPEEVGNAGINCRHGQVEFRRVLRVGATPCDEPAQGVNNDAALSLEVPMCLDNQDSEKIAKR
jgi:hypothetical protein